MRWHHLAGLIFSVFVCTWIFSGLMSMNPLKIFSPAEGGPDMAAYRGKPVTPADALLRPDRIVRALEEANFAPVELRWHRLDGEEYVQAYDTDTRTRVIRAGPDSMLQVATTWDVAEVLPAAQRLFSPPAATHRVIDHYDSYYYQRHPEALNGSSVPGLPALRLDYEDSGGTRVYIDLRTGNMAMSLDRPQRVNRWLFNFLHSWDVQPLLRGGLLRELAIIALSLGGLVVSLTGAVIGWRRLRRKFAARS